MPRSPRTKTVTAVQAGQYLMKAEEFLAVAEDCLEADRFIAATGNAVHAAINAGDAVAGIRTRQRAAELDHSRAISFLEKAGPDGKEVARHLARLLPLKTKAEYDPDQVPKATAAKAVQSAQRAVAVARRIVPTN